MNRYSIYMSLWYTDPMGTRFSDPGHQVPTVFYDPRNPHTPYISHAPKTPESTRKIGFFMHTWIQVDVPEHMQKEIGQKEVRLEFRSGYLNGVGSDHTIEGPHKWAYPEWFTWELESTPGQNEKLIKTWQKLADAEGGYFSPSYNLIPNNCWTHTLWFMNEGKVGPMEIMGEALRIHHEVTGGHMFDAGKF